MAHNNGMIPRGSGQGFEEAPAKGFGLMTGAEIAGFVPHAAQKILLFNKSRHDAGRSTS
ncbi:MAG: hypothetical protein WCA78_03005 [Rhizomicrobium sp.]